MDSRQVAHDAERPNSRLSSQQRRTELTSVFFFERWCNRLRYLCPFSRTSSFLFKHVQPREILFHAFSELSQLRFTSVVTPKCRPSRDPTNAHLSEPSYWDAAIFQFMRYLCSIACGTSLMLYSLLPCCALNKCLAGKSWLFLHTQLATFRRGRNDYKISKPVIVDAYSRR